MKKVLFIINSLKCGGAERLLLDIVKRMPAGEYDVSILTFNRSVMFDDRLPGNVRLLHALNVGSRFSHYSRKFLSAMGLADYYYRRQIRRAAGCYDTVISFLEGFPLRAHGYLQDRGRKHITFVHTDLSTYPDSLLQFADKGQAAEAYNKMDNIVFVSKGALDGFNRCFDSIKSPKTVLENGIDIDAIREKSLAESFDTKGLGVVTVGRVTDVKGFDIIPEIARILKDKKTAVSFTIVGDGGGMTALKSKIKALGVEDMVHPVGFRSNPYPYIACSDLYISTSVTEGLPLSLCEAMALGKPVIASPTAGAQELLSDGTGIVVERRAEEYVRAILQLMNDPAAMAGYAAKSLAKAERYDSQRYMASFLKLL